MADERIEVEIVLDDGSIKKGFATLKQEGDKASKKLDKKLGSSFDGLGKKLLGLGAVFGSVFAGRKILEAAKIQENAVQQLNTSLKLAGSFSQEASESFQEFASSLQQSSRFGDEVILQQIALARNFTKTNEEAQALTAAAVDLSEATGISLDSAVKNLGKSYSGLAGELGESIPALRALTKEQLQAGGAITLVQERFGGAAAANVQTFSGRIEQLSNLFGDLLEEIGFIVTKSPVLSKIFGDIADGLVSGISALKEFRKSGDIIGTVINNLLVFKDAITNLFILPLEVAFNGVVAAFDSIKTGIQTLIAGTAGIIADFVSVIAPDSSIAQNIQAFADSSADVLVDFANETSESLGNVFDTDITQSANAYLSRLQEFGITASMAAKETLTDPINNQVIETSDNIWTLSNSFGEFGAMAVDSFKSLGEAFGETVKFTKEQSNQMAKTLKGTLAKGVVSSVQTFVSAVASGKDAFAALGASVLSMIGDMAISIGQFIVTTGIGKIALESLPGGATVAAGLGLIALGTLLKSISGSQFSGGGAGDTGAPTGGAPAEPDVETTAIAEEDVTEPDTGVTINVEGTVVDPKSTGETIAATLQEYFDASGGQLVVAS